MPPVPAERTPAGGVAPRGGSAERGTRFNKLKCCDGACADVDAPRDGVRDLLDEIESPAPKKAKPPQRADPADLEIRW